jgi:transposase
LRSHIKKEVKYKKRCEQKRNEFASQITEFDINNLIYIDETGVDNNMSKLRGWAEKGCKSFTEALGFRTKRITLIAGYCYGTKELIAPMEYDGYTNSEVFITWVERLLCKELKPNQVVIMDNASFHKSSKVKDLIESVGGKLIYLPPYSPDLNPIEHVWANLKRLIRVHPNREKNLQLAIDESIGLLFMG